MKDSLAKIQKNFFSQKTVIEFVKASDQKPQVKPKQSLVYIQKRSNSSKTHPVQGRQFNSFKQQPRYENKNLFNSQQKKSHIYFQNKTNLGIRNSFHNCCYQFSHHSENYFESKKFENNIFYKKIFNRKKSQNK